MVFYTKIAVKQHYVMQERRVNPACRFETPVSQIRAQI